MPLPSKNAFDRLIDHDTPWQSNTDLGGVSLTLDTEDRLRCTYFEYCMALLIGILPMTETLPVCRHWQNQQNPAKHATGRSEVRQQDRYLPV